MRFSLLIVLAIGLELKDEACSSSQNFKKQSFQLTSYPPDNLGYSQPVVHGVFNQATFVDYIIGSWSTDGSNWNDYIQPIDTTYPSSIEVILAPWIQLTSLPDSNTGDYFGKVKIFGDISGDGSSKLISCIDFRIPALEYYL